MGLIDVWDETPGACAIGVIFGAEGFAQEPLLRVDAGKHNDEHQDGDRHANAGAECAPPAQRKDKEAEIARVADDPIEAGK